MTARVWAYVMATAATVYMAFAVWQAYLFAKSGSGLALALAVAVLALPLIGLWLVWREIAFASRVQRLADGLAARGQLPPELPRTPGGRVVPAPKLMRQLADAGIDPNQEIITYCSCGVRSALAAVILSARGVPKVRNYDGSLAEWAADPALPMAK